ncbi:MAG: hypothetical protein HWE27_06105 [Gammaproteobacteria bacterium]|nr:hypothetical protein [Gammaproteobacteria bacterium]
MHIDKSFSSGSGNNCLTGKSLLGIKGVLYSSLMVIGLNAFAHEEPMEKGWCSQGNIQIMGTFNFTAALLERFRSEQNPVCNQYKSCGQFDDDYSLAIRAGNSLCHSFDIEEREFKNQGDFGTVRLIIHGPASLKNSEKSHHLLYDIRQGAHFSCAVCVENTAEPIKDVEVTR